MDDFHQWEIKFDSAREALGAVQAWKELVQHDCDPQVLKSALYRAAEYFFGAQEAPTAFAAYSQARETVLCEIANLKEALRRLMEIRTGGGQLASDLLQLHVVDKKDASLFKQFPELLKAFENVLLIAAAPEMKKNSFRSDLKATGEALLHIYVQETTGKQFPNEVSVLLETATDCYGTKHRSKEFTREAVEKRFRRFRKSHKRSYEVIRRLVRVFRAGRIDADEQLFDLARFVDSRIIKLPSQ